MAFVPDLDDLDLMAGWPLRFVYVLDACEDGMPEDPQVFTEERDARRTFEQVAQRCGARRMGPKEGGNAALMDHARGHHGDRIDLWKVPQPTACGGVTFVVQTRSSRISPPIVFGDRPTAERHYRNMVGMELGCLGRDVPPLSSQQSWARGGDHERGREVWLWTARVLRPQTDGVSPRIVRT